MPTTRRTWNTTRRTTTKYNKSYGGTSYRNTTTTRGYTPNTYNPNQYNTQKKTLQAKICSYNTIHRQMTGAGKVMAFSPTGANKWIRYVENGAWVYRFNSQQFKQFWGNTWNNPTPTAACRYLQHKFGQGIKDVTRGKGNYWLVAATQNINSRPFSNYNWK